MSKSDDFNSAARLLAGPCFGLFDNSPALTYSENTVLFKQGATARDVYLLEQGLVKVIFLDPGGEEVIIELCSAPGALIGDACAVIGKHAVSASMRYRPPWSPATRGCAGWRRRASSS